MKKWLFHLLRAVKLSVSSAISNEEKEGETARQRVDQVLKIKGSCRSGGWVGVGAKAGRWAGGLDRREALPLSVPEEASAKEKSEEGTDTRVALKLTRKGTIERRK